MELGIWRGRKLLYLYGSLLLNQVLAFLSFPYLARTLGPEAFGVWASLQAGAFPLLLLMDFGLGVWATREVARGREVSLVASGFLGGRLLLGGVGLLLGGVVLGERYGLGLALPVLLWLWSWVLPPFYHLEGRGEHLLPAFSWLGNRAVALVLLLLFVKGPEDLPRLPFLLMASVLIPLLLGFLSLVREVGLPRPRLLPTWEALKGGVPFLLSGIGGSLLGLGPFLIGFRASPQEAGHWAAAERILRVTQEGLRPLAIFLFPRLSQGPLPGFRRLAHLGLLLGLGLGLGLFLLPPLLPLFLGSYEGSVDLLRGMAPLLPLMGVNLILKTFLEARGREKPLALLQLLLGLIFPFLFLILPSPLLALYGVEGLLLLGQVALWKGLGSLGRIG